MVIAPGLAFLFLLLQACISCLCRSHWWIMLSEINPSFSHSISSISYKTCHYMFYYKRKRCHRDTGHTFKIWLIMAKIQNIVCNSPLSVTIHYLSFPIVCHHPLYVIHYCQSFPIVCHSPFSSVIQQSVIHQLLSFIIICHFPLIVYHFELCVNFSIVHPWMSFCIIFNWHFQHTTEG